MVGFGELVGEFGKVFVECNELLIILVECVDK